MLGLENETLTPTLRKRGAGRPPAETLKAHKEAILEAATEVFLEKGFIKASTSEIARRAGASKQTLYSLYPSKSALYAGLMQRRLATFLAPLHQQMQQQPPMPVRQMLLNYGTGLVRWVSSDECMRIQRLLISEAEQFPDLGACFWQNGPGRDIDSLAQYLESQVKNGTLSMENPKAAALQFVGMLAGIVQLRGSMCLEPLHKTEEEVYRWASSCVDLFLCAYASRVH